MTAKNIVSKVTLALAVAALVLPVSDVAMAGGYGYGSQSGWSGYQAHTPKRQKVRQHSYAGSNRHLAWCYNRYRSYRLMDNTFQPYHGPRQECLSPYEQERRALFVGYPGEAPEILFRDQAGSGSQQVERDTFGNLSETGPVGTAIAGGNGGKSDEFGNLPEQAAVSGTVAPAVESQPGTNATQAPVEPAVTATPAATQAPAVEPVVTDSPAPSTEADSQVSAETDATTQTAKAVPLEEVSEQSENPASAD